jgi:hypothetical protein
MNKKILAGIIIAIVAAGIGIVSIKAMLGDEATELPYEETAEKTLNLQEPSESGESGESAEDEARENNP